MGFNIGTRFTKAAKVGVVKKHIGGKLHFVNVEVRPKVPAGFVMKWIFGTAYMVLVRARCCAKASMGFGNNGKYFLNGNVAGKYIV
jgi:hypothetical protein